ncbi:MAG TPA: hypothetical protein VF502_15995 [Stellaceae bacterium]
MTSDSPTEELPIVRAKSKPRASYRLAGNYFAQLFNQLVRIGWMLLLVPLYLAVWGPETYKDWIVIVALATFLASCNLGLTSYFGNRFIELVARHDHDAFRRELRKSLCCTLGVGAIVVVAGLGLILAYHLKGGLSTGGMTEAAFLGCLLLVAFPVPLSFWEETLVTIYRAQGEFTRGECVFAIHLTTLLVTVAALLALRMPPLVVASCFPIIQMMVLTGVFVDLRRRYEDITIGLAVPSLAELRRIMPQALLFFTAPLVMALVQSGPIMLFQLFGVAAVPIIGYTLMRTVTGLARQAAYAFAVGSGIEMARHEVRGEREACQQLYQITGKIVTGLAGLFGGFTLWAAGPFLLLWTHGTVVGDWALVLAFLGGILLSAPGQAGLMLLTYANFPRPLAVAWCTQAALGLTLAAAFIPFFGVAAAALSLAVAEILWIGLYVPFVVQRLFRFSAAQQLMRCFAVGVPVFAWSALVAKFAFELSLGGFLGLIATAALWSVLAVPPCVLIVLPPQYKRTLLSRLRRFARARPKLV